MSRVIYIYREDDEHVHVQGEGIDLYANHDEHGWSGMDVLVSAVKVRAQAFGAEVVDQGDGCSCCKEAPDGVSVVDGKETCDFCGHPTEEHAE